MHRPTLFLALLLSLATPGLRAAPPAIAYSPFQGAEHGSHVRSGEGAKVQKFPGATDPAISPDGKQLVVTLQLKAGRRLGIVDLASGKTRTLPIEAKEVYGGLWSPKGDWIAFNHYAGATWTVALIHPDGTGFHLITEESAKKSGIYLAGWNLKTGEPLAHNLETLWQFTIEGKKVWERPLAKLVGTNSIDSSCRFWVGTDGHTLIGNVEVDQDEIPNTDGPSDYLVTADLDSGKHERITPKGLSAQAPFLTYDGSAVLFEGFTGKDIKRGKGDSISLKMRAYRMDLVERKPVPLFENASGPTQAAQ